MIKLSIRFPKVLSERTQKKALSVALQNGTQRYLEMIHDYIDEGKAFTPRTGHLQRSIGYRKKSALEYEIYANAEYAPFVEFGTKPHVIKPKNKLALSWVKGNRRFFAKKVKHPGSKPYSFFYAEADRRPEETKKTILEVFLEELNG